MIVTIESRAKPCPGVEEAIALTEECLRHGESLVTLGELIHNRREIGRLKNLGLRHVTQDELNALLQAEANTYRFLVRTHGESMEILNQIKSHGISIVDTTCPIVKHSQALIDQHVREGWSIIIVGNENHAEVRALKTRIPGNGSVISKLEEAETGEFDDRTLLIAQTTVDPAFFSEVRKVLSAKLTRLKIVDTTCRYVRNRQKDIEAFSESNDVVIFVCGPNSANCRLLYETAKTVNPSVYLVEASDQIQKVWLKDVERVGISGGASTPRWQLDELARALEAIQDKKSPKGEKNRKGGKYSWWKRKNPKKTE